MRKKRAKISRKNTEFFLDCTFWRKFIKKSKILSIKCRKFLRINFRENIFTIFHFAEKFAKYKRKCLQFLRKVLFARNPTLNSHPLWVTLYLKRDIHWDFKGGPVHNGILDHIVFWFEKVFNLQNFLHSSEPRNPQVTFL